MEKDFEQWIALKKILNSQDVPTFQQQEIWWCSIGANVGDEEDGKNTGFNRPVLVIKKFNKHIFLGAPLTTKIKDNPYYHKIHFKNIDQSVMISQIRVWDCRRFTHKIGKLSDKQFKGIKGKLKDILS